MKRLFHSVLDFGIIAPGRSGPSVFEESLALAQALDVLGYHRLWLSEHHEQHYCWAGPEIVATAVAQRTSRIGVGTAAVLLPLRNPLVLAETFRVMEALTPGRVALGVCGSVPQDLVALDALSESSAAQPAQVSSFFAAKLSALIEYLEGTQITGHRFERGATPCFTAAPPIWLMGSSGHSAAIASSSCVNYAYSLFHRGSQSRPDVTKTYRTEHPTGRLALAATCICAETSVEAQAQRRKIEAWLGDDMRVIICGTPESCHDQALELADTFEADELILLHAWDLHAPRIAAVAIMAELFGIRRELVE